MANGLIINIRKRGTSSCLEPDTRLEVVEGERIVIALERIADAFEAKPNVKGEGDGYTDEEYKKNVREIKEMGAFLKEREHEGTKENETAYEPSEHSLLECQAKIGFAMIELDDIMNTFAHSCTTFFKKDSDKVIVLRLPVYSAIDLLELKLSIARIERHLNAAKAAIGAE